MNKLAFGQYYNTDSFLHRLDQEKYGFIYLGGLFVLVIILVLLSNVPIKMYLKSLKQVTFLLMFSFIFQLLFNRGGEQLEVLPEINIHLNLINITIILGLLIIYFLTKKYVNFKFFYMLLILVLSIYILTLSFNQNALFEYKVIVYEDGVITGLFIILRVFVLIIFSSLLTLTTKPTDINNGLESLLKPFEMIGLKTSILSMMISISLRYIPTLFIETEKILKAQASRGVDFNEGKFKDKVIQIVSLLIPMFVISFKRASELADAMEARGYIPGEKRTKIQEVKFRFKDFMSLILMISILTVIILGRVL